MTARISKPGGSVPRASLVCPVRINGVVRSVREIIALEENEPYLVVKDH